MEMREQPSHLAVMTAKRPPRDETLSSFCDFFDSKEY